MPERTATKTARLLVLHELQQAGYLDHATLQSIADVFDVNRSTILRDLRSLVAVQPLILEMRQLWLTAHPPLSNNFPSPEFLPGEGARG